MANDDNPDNDCRLTMIILDYIHDVGVKEITEPSVRFYDDEWIHFDGANNYSVGAGGGSTFEAAIRITPDELVEYDNNYEITTVKFYYYGDAAPSGNIKIYESGTSTSPGALITSEPYTVTGVGWFEIPLSNPVYLDTSEDVWVSVEISGRWPMGVDDGPAVGGKGDWYYHESLGWTELTDYGLNCNWNIWAKVEEMDEWPLGTYPVEGVVKNYGAFNESDFNVNAAIYNVDDDKVFYRDDVVVSTVLYLHDEITVTFEDVTFEYVDMGTYRLEITTELDDDGKLDNDQNTDVFVIKGIMDTIPPTITLEKENLGLMRFKFTATVSDPEPSSGIDRVEFYLDGLQRKIDTEEPYEWTYRGAGNHTVTATVYDNAGNSNSDSMSAPQSTFQLIDRFTQRFPILEWIFSYFFRVIDVRNC